MSALIFFDIDGTLLLSGGAGMRGMTRAFEAVFGVADAFSGIAAAGYTDTYLLTEALTRAGLDDTPDAHAAFRDAYVSILVEEIQKPGTGRKEVMPGVRQLLAAVGGRDGLHTALLTGNYERAARIKLAHFDLDTHFAWGVFGEEAADRNELGRRAMARALARAIPTPACQNAVVIGDTPHDIACAHAAGARAIAVATGFCSIDELRSAGAEAVLPDLSDTAAVLRLLL